jgi:hypothetical protein
MGNTVGMGKKRLLRLYSDPEESADRQFVIRLDNTKIKQAK